MLSIFLQTLCLPNYSYVSKYIVPLIFFAVPQPRFVVKPAKINMNQTTRDTQIETIEAEVTNVTATTESSHEPEEAEQEVEDTHRCGKCGIEFTTLEEYIKHKLYGEKCRVCSKHFFPYFVHNYGVSKVIWVTQSLKNSRFYLWGM